MIPIKKDKIERENYKVRQQFISEVFVSFFEKCYGNKYYFHKISYYFGNGHPCISIIWTKNKEIETKIEFCNNGKVILKVKYLNQENKNRYCSAGEFKFDRNISHKKNREKLFIKLKSVVLSFCDHPYYFNFDVPDIRNKNNPNVLYCHFLLRRFLLKLKNDIILKNVPTYINCYFNTISSRDKFLKILNNYSFVYKKNNCVYICDFIKNIIKNSKSEAEKEHKLKIIVKSI